jgi:predicted nucleic acid-binding protein
VIVIDASAIVDYLLEFEPQASWAAEHMAGAASLHAPHAVDVEVLSTFRRRVLGSQLSGARARLALDDFHALPIRRYPQKPFLDRAWELHNNLRVPDALYVALSEALEAPLVTTDQRLVGAPGLRAEIIAFPDELSDHGD